MHNFLIISSLFFLEASRYDIHISNSRVQLVNNASFTPLVRIEDIIEGNISSPSEAGTRETFVIRVHFPPGMETVSYHFGVLAEDDAGNYGNVSTPVQAVFQNLSVAVPEEYLSTESAVTTIMQEDISTEIFNDITTLTSRSTSHSTSHSSSHSTSITAATKAISTAQPGYCEKHNCPFVIVLAISMSVCPACLLLGSLCTVLIYRQRQRWKVRTLDVELTEQPTDKTSNRT